MTGTTEYMGRFFDKRDLVFISILLGIGLAVGFYLIATTVVIAKDGVFYIDRAQKLSTEGVEIIRTHPPGYPLMILGGQRIAGLFADGSSVYCWIYSAQGVTLLCRMVALVGLYFVGKLFVGGRRSFWSLLVFIVLPYPARFGSDALRDWPHLMFLALGFLFLVRAAKENKVWMYGVAGLLAGLGHIVRPECAQLVVYAFLWLIVRFVWPKDGMSRVRCVCAMIVCLICFALPVGPYVKARGRLMPSKLHDVVSSSVMLKHGNVQEEGGEAYVAGNFVGGVGSASARLVEEVCDDLMYVFVVPLVVGIWWRLRRGGDAGAVERFFVPTFIIANVVMLILLHCEHEYISRRHCMPLIAVPIFYVGVGLEILAEGIRKRFSKGKGQIARDSERWFFVLVAVGMAVCVPKLVMPIRIDKAGYRDAARWLEEHTDRQEIIATDDTRIAFYANRKRVRLRDMSAVIGLDRSVRHVLQVFKNEDAHLNFNKKAEVETEDEWIEVYSVGVDSRGKKKNKVVIYRLR